LKKIISAEKLFGVEWANVQPHSGSQAIIAVLDVANLIDSVLTNKTSAITLNKLREKVREFISEFTIY